MKVGKTLVELAQELERQKNGKRDFVADTRELKLITNHGEDVGVITPRFSMGINGHGVYDITDHTHQQIAQRVGIPQKYYDRMETVAPHLLAKNVHHWFRSNPERRMIRTLDGNARAFLSDRYRPLDNYDLANAVLPVLQEANDIKIESTEITATRMYIKALFPKMKLEVKRGDAVQSGIVISNSEIGMGAVKIEPLVFRLVCLNGMIAADHATKKYHIGRAADGGEAAMELYRDETLKQDDRAFWMKVQDTVRGSLDMAKFELIVKRLRDSTMRIIDADPIKAVEVVSERFQLSDKEQSGVLRHLIQGGDLSQYGLVNAITRCSQDVDDYDRATDFERLGGAVLELPASDWKAIAQAA